MQKSDIGKGSSLSKRICMPGMCVEATVKNCDTVAKGLSGMGRPGYVCSVHLLIMH